MVAFALGRPSTCLSCLRRLAVDGSAKSRAAPSLSLVQTRGKTFRPGIRHGQGVLVRLLQDIPRFGAKDAIFRLTQPGPMRNKWYPRKMAEYVTAQRFLELGLTRADIGERDPLFGVSPGAGKDDASAEDQLAGNGAEDESVGNIKKTDWEDLVNTKGWD